MSFSRVLITCLLGLVVCPVIADEAAINAAKWEGMGATHCTSKASKPSGYLSRALNSVRNFGNNVSGVFSNAGAAIKGGANNFGAKLRSRFSNVSGAVSNGCSTVANSKLCSFAKRLFTNKVFVATTAVGAVAYSRMAANGNVAASGVASKFADENLNRHPVAIPVIRIIATVKGLVGAKAAQAGYSYSEIYSSQGFGALLGAIMWNIAN
jgi:hypothetical protein